MTKEELMDWGKATIKVYNGIADELGRNNVPAFYSQSDLNNIVGTDSVDVLIAGINPGSGGNYEDMIANPNWGIDPHRGMTAEQLVSGNFCKNLNMEIAQAGVCITHGIISEILKSISVV